jgi:DNA-binding SARP family transcriptional activator
MQVRLLGPVDVVTDGRPRPVPGLRRRAVLATLALHSGEVVSTGRLVDAVWGDAAPLKVLNTLQTNVSFLRNMLGSKAAIIARGPGYILDLGDDLTDVQLAEQLLRRGTQSADPARGAEHLQAALALWRGQPLADLSGLAWLEEQAVRLDLLAVHVRRALLEAKLAAGEHAQLVPELEQMAADNPLDEQIHAQLMLALYRNARQADALGVYHRLRRTLGEQLGIDPGQRLRDLETAILRQDQSLDAPQSVSPAGTLAMPVPAQLPSATAVFVGRGAQLASLDALLPATAQAGAPGPAAVGIAAISGTAGVGKTALAVHWGHRVAAQFPDGQLYADMRGFDPDGAALKPAEVLRGFLDALGVPPARIPEGLPALAGLYRSLLAGKRILVLLDNAEDAAHARPLLPGSPGCLAIVTSRTRLTGLVATEGAFALTLDPLATGDARELLARRIGPDRVAREEKAADDIIAGCAGLPLALTIAAARAGASPGFPLRVFAAELREATRVLDPLNGGDVATDVRAVFSWSYHALTPEAARLFRLLSLHPGPDVALPAAASLAAIGLHQARALLGELTHAHLLAEHVPGRYAFHDLLRAYATELARMHDSIDIRSAAVRRVLDHYLHTGVLLIFRTADPPGSSLGRTGSSAEEMEEVPA